MFRFLVLFSVFVIIASCGTNNEQDNRTIFRYNESAGITSLDPISTRSLENMWAVNQLFDGLVELDSSLKIIPLIAKKMGCSRQWYYLHIYFTIGCVFSYQ